MSQILWLYFKSSQLLKVNLGVLKLFKPPQITTKSKDKFPQEVNNIWNFKVFLQAICSVISSIQSKMTRLMRNEATWTEPVKTQNNKNRPTGSPDISFIILGL